MITVWHCDLIVVNGEGVGILKLGGCPLNDALRLHIAIIGAIEHEDRVAKRFGDEDLVPSWIGPVLPDLETVNAAAHLGLVAFDMPLWMHGAIAGACVGREAWMAHAVWRYDLVTGKGKRPGVADTNDRYFGSNLDRPLWARVIITAVPFPCIEFDRATVPVRHHQLVAGVVDKHPARHGV